MRPDGGYHMRSRAAADIGVGVGSWCNNGLLGGLGIEPDRRWEIFAEDEGVMAVSCGSNSELCLQSHQCLNTRPCLQGHAARHCM